MIRRLLAVAQGGPKNASIANIKMVEGKGGTYGAYAHPKTPHQNHQPKSHTPHILPHRYKPPTQDGMRRDEGPPPGGCGGSGG